LTDSRVLEFIEAFVAFYRTSSSPAFRGVIAVLRGVTLDWLVRLLEAHAAEPLYWPCNLFLTFFFQFMSDDRMRPILARETVRVVSGGPAILCGNVIVAIVTMISELHASVDKLETLVLAGDLIAIIREIGTQGEDVSSYANPMLGVLFKLVSHLRPGKQSQLLLFTFLECLTHIG
jgi:hypothetical protein